MRNKIINVLVFAVGAAIGSAVTWKVIQTKYERIMQEEIDAFKESYAECMDNCDVIDDCEHDEADEETEKQINWDELEDLDEEEDDDKSNNDLREYARLIEQYTKEEGGAEDMSKDAANMPYVISPYDFGELDGYSQVELTYYADGTLEDDEYNIITDSDELLGPKALYTFGEYEDDSVFVRNDRLRADFQILRDYRTYAEARSIGPGQVDDE